MRRLQDVLRTIESWHSESEEDRIEAYNACQCGLGSMVQDVSPDPACSPRLIPASAIRGNDYNPNKVASPELDLLQQSIEADGITMAIVVMRADDDTVEVIDGFHRHLVASGRLGRTYLPCSIIQSPLADRMASTVRHNRARGKHQVDLMAHLVKSMMALGWDETKIAEALGMSEEELLRLRQMVGTARLLAGEEYSQSWGTILETEEVESE